MYHSDGGPQPSSLIRRTRQYYSSRQRHPHQTASGTQDPAACVTHAGVVAFPDLMPLLPCRCPPLDTSRSSAIHKACTPLTWHGLLTRPTSPPSTPESPRLPSLSVLCLAQRGIARLHYTTQHNTTQPQLRWSVFLPTLICELSYTLHFSPQPLVAQPQSLPVRFVCASLTT